MGSNLILIAAMLFNSAWIFVAFLTGLSQGQKFGPSSEEGPKIVPVCGSSEQSPFGKFDPVAKTYWPTDNYGRKSKGSGTFTNCNCDGRNKLYCPDIKGSSVLHCCPNSHFDNINCPPAY
ncbi:uncharacterized protein PGTG_02511 [Puccinia graminis f. sp. tritici CRL 75-36-700-3]|uniref:Uncharacterized protein n=2 Tax=Puccinia graminis f. sp. tritici TaxID=56615 RepID=E3JVJ5_PUCGT|nr:uncharacterized protein PGTG_02511 [Puccinia graminis f. sp. tritici CRL 75-36-700-3]EFP76070.1 hypothetical protein PGTG_02511 [Puccinia graminis f. sp. tritici CRL 75-36-700-3]